MAARPSAVNFYSLNCSWTMMLSGEITNRLAVWLKAESFTKQNTLNGKSIMACEVRFPRFDLLRFQLKAFCCWKGR